MCCSKCGSQVDGKFCPNCGTPVLEDSQDQAPTLVEDTPQSAPAAPQNVAEQKEFLLEKVKMIGNAKYKTIKTTVIVEAKSVEIKMNIKKFLRKVRTTEKVIPFTSIQKASVRTVMDFWDTLYGIIFAVLGFSAPILFLGAIVCLWCGYGKEIEILLSNGEKFHIPTNSGSTANALVDLLNKR